MGPWAWEGQEGIYKGHRLLGVKAFLWQPECDPGGTGTCSNSTASLSTGTGPHPTSAARQERKPFATLKRLGPFLLRRWGKHHSTLVCVTLEGATLRHAEGPCHKEAGLSI